MEAPSLWKPALIAGGIFGFISGVPFLGALNVACCSLIVGAGALAATMMVRASVASGSAMPLTYGRAALGGMVAGAVASPAQSITSLLFTVVVLRRDPAEQIQEAVSSMSQVMPNASDAIRVIESIPIAVMELMSMVVFMFVFAAFGAIGGVIGRAISEKRTAAPPTPPVPAGPTIAS